MPKETTGPWPKYDAFDPDYVKYIEECASRGLTKQQICDSLGIHHSTYYEYQDKNPEIAAAYKRGAGHGVKAVANKLYEKAIDGDNTCILFYLKCKGGFKESHNIEISAAEPLAINVSDMDAEQLMDVIKKAKRR